MLSKRVWHKIPVEVFSSLSSDGSPWMEIGKTDLHGWKLAISKTVYGKTDLHGWKLSSCKTVYGKTSPTERQQYFNLSLWRMSQLVFFFFFLLFSFIGHFSQGIVNILLFFRNDTAQINEIFQNTRKHYNYFHKLRYQN